MTATSAIHRQFKLNKVKEEIVKQARESVAYARTQQVVSSDAQKLAVVALGGSGVGGYAVQVDRMASAAQRTYAFDPDSDQTLTVGTSTFTFPAGTTLGVGQRGLVVGNAAAFQARDLPALSVLGHSQGDRAVRRGHAHLCAAVRFADRDWQI